MIIYTFPPKENPEHVEGESLATHVMLCRQRDLSTTKRLSEIDERQDKIETRESELRSYILRTITTAAIALLSSAISLGVMISSFIK
jgi:hypothetical protein